MKVGIVGASGIGKQHAKWFHIEGCDVVAFVGTSENSVSSTSSVLKGLFNFNGKGYVNFEEMLREEMSEIVVVSSPFNLHYEHCMSALEYGANVYCEKPFVWDTSLSVEDILDRSMKILSKSKENNLMVGVNIQYVAAVSYYNEIRKKFLEHLDKPRTFYFEMQSKWSGKNASYQDLLLDMLPHSIGMMLEFFSSVNLLNESLKFNIQSTESVIQFDFKDGVGDLCPVKIFCRKIPEGATVCRFGVNDFIVDYNGRNDENGIFSTYLKYEDHEFKYEDLMRVSIRKFIQAVESKDSSLMLVSTDQAYKNLELQAVLHREISKQLVL